MFYLFLKLYRGSSCLKREIRGRAGFAGEEIYMIFNILRGASALSVDTVTPAHVTGKIAGLVVEGARWAFPVFPHS